MQGKLNNRILLVEDDDALSREIVMAFAAEAIFVERVRDPEELLRTRDAAVIVLDRLIGNSDSIYVLEQLRAAGDRTPTIIVSSLSSVEERIHGLRSGADDYLIKPFAMGELIARVEAARRRVDGEQKTVLIEGPLVMDRISRKVRRSGREVDLLPREYCLLEYLMQNAGVVVTQSMLLEHVWNIHSPTPTNVINVHIGSLRRKIDADEGERLIASIRGVGFRLGVPVPRGHRRD